MAGKDLTAEDASGPTMLLGLGNPILGDDGVGCAVADLIGSRIGSLDGLRVISASVSPVRLVDEIAGCSRLVIVDSVTTGNAEPGELLELDLPEDLPAPISCHHFSVGQLLGMGEALGLPMPEYLKIYGIEIVRPEEYCDRLSGPMEELLPSIADEIIRRELADFIQTGRSGQPRGERAV